MSFKVTIKDIGTEASLNELRAKLQNMSKPLTMAGMYMERETKLNFAKEADPDGNKWAALKPSTLRYKKTSSILRETGALAGSVRMTPATNKQVKVKASKSYGIFHQTGTSKMAARPFIGIGAQHKPKIKQVFQEYFEL